MRAILLLFLGINFMCLAQEDELLFTSYEGRWTPEHGQRQLLDSLMSHITAPEYVDSVFEEKCMISHRIFYSFTIDTLGQAAEISRIGSKPDPICETRQTDQEVTRALNSVTWIWDGDPKKKTKSYYKVPIKISYR